MKTALLILFAAFFATPAAACLPARPEELTPEWQTNLQAGQWDGSEKVFLAEVVATRSIYLGDEPRGPLFVPQIGYSGASVTIRPIRALKGETPQGDIVLSHTNGSMCGPWPNWDVLYGQTGGLYVIFSGEVPTQENVRGSLSPERVLEPRLRDALLGASH